MLCAIIRNKFNNGRLLECGAYKKNLYLTSVDKQNSIPIINERLGYHNLTNKEKYFIGYTEQQLKLNSDRVYSKFQFHVCLVTNNRNPILLKLDDHTKKIKYIFTKMYHKIYNTQVEVLYLSCDHVHLHVNISSNLILDEIVREIARISNEEIISIYSDVTNEFKSFWEKWYFAEKIGCGFAA